MVNMVKREYIYIVSALKLIGFHLANMLVSLVRVKKVISLLDLLHITLHFTNVHV